MLAQWCQPTDNVTHNEISDHLDSLATEVKVIVQQEYPGHPVLTTEVNNGNKCLFSNVTKYKKSTMA